MQSNLDIITHDFSLQIEQTVKNRNVSYIDAIVLWCEAHNKEISVGADLVKKTPIIKDKIKIEAEDLNLLPKSSRLPL